MQHRILLFSVLSILFSTSAIAQQESQVESPSTIAESSGFKSTSTSAQVIDFMAQLDSAAEHVRQFEFGRTVEDRPMVGVTVCHPAWDPQSPDGRIVALVVGNIHGGECSGKEAILMLARELAADINHRWLKNVVCVFVPNYNADGNDRIGLNNRRGQNGPENGMGRRENAQNLDLNRDFVKLESPEARALVKLIDNINPHLFIDCHTTNGSKHRYALTYDIPHNPATAGPIRNFLRNKMMPAVTSKMAAENWQTFYYGNFNKDKTAWTTFGHEPRYSTEYVGLRGRLAVLSEAYSYASFRDRVLATEAFLSSCLDFAADNAGPISELLKYIDDDLIRLADRNPERIDVPLNARAEAFDQKVPILGFRDDQPHEFECDFVGNYVATRSVSLPFAYCIPANLPRIADRLRMHGIDVEVLDKSVTANVKVESISSINRNERVFQKHKMSQVQVERDEKSIDVPAGTFVVRTAQPTGRLAAYLLESESDDGFVFWNFLDSFLDVGEPYPIIRLTQPVALKTRSVEGGDLAGRLKLDDIGGQNSIARSTIAPSWVDDKIQVELYGRKLLMEPESMALVKPLPPLFDHQELAEQLSGQGIGEPEAVVDFLKRPPIASSDRRYLVFAANDRALVMDTLTSQTRLIGRAGSKAEVFTFSPDQRLLAYVDRDGLQILNLKSWQAVSFQSENPDDVLIGKLDWVYQEELYGRGNFKGYWFSPDSARVAFLRLDQSNVAEFAINDHLPVRGDNELMRYPKAGDANPVVSVGFARADDERSLNWIDLSRYEDQEILVSNVSWNPDGTFLLVQIQNREQTWLDLLSVDMESGNQKVLFRDQTPAWITSPGAPNWLDDDRFVWISPRDGYRHLYLYQSDGRLDQQLTSGEWEVRSIEAIDNVNAIVYFLSAKENPTQLHLFGLDLQSGKISRLTQQPGSHRIQFNSDATMFIDSFSSYESPTTHHLCDVGGNLLHVLNASSDDRFRYAGLSPTNEFAIETAGQPLDASIIYPPGFDVSKRYPVLMHVYAGPQAPVVRNRFGGSWDLWHQFMAQQGYVVFKCDNQSSSYRSSRNVWPIHRELGKSELADIEQGVQWLKEQNWVDPNRIGIWGWSYGGYMTAYALTHSQSFKIGIAGAPVTDWRNYDSIYTERLMGLPQENETGYRSSSVVESANDLHGKLLLIHGSIDDNVHLNNTMQLAYALQNANKSFQLMIYPANRHAIGRPDQARHLRQLMYEFITENL